MIKALIPATLVLISAWHYGLAESQGGATQERTQQDKPAQDLDQQRAELVKILAKEGIKIDFKQKVIRVSGAININNDFLEYIAIGPRGKKHEALIILECKGSMLNAAMLAIGYKPGKNVDYKPVEPMPSEEQVRQGAPTQIIVPPKGMRVYLALEWEDAKKQKVSYAIEDLLLDMQADAPIQKAEWIYFGGMTRAIYRGEPPVFVADYDQNYISNYYVKPDSHLITLHHERAAEDQNWWPCTDRLPERGTPCTLILSMTELVKRKPVKKQKDPKKDGK